MKKVLAIILGLILMGTVVGCKTLESDAKTDQIRAIAYHNITWRMINGSVDRAESIANYSANLITLIENGQVTDLSVIQDTLDKFSIDLKLTPMEIMSLKDLVGLFTADLSTDIPEVEKIKQVVLPRLKWINEAAVQMRDYLLNQK